MGASAGGVYGSYAAPGKGSGIGVEDAEAVVLVADAEEVVEDGGRSSVELCEDSRLAVDAEAESAVLGATSLVDDASLTIAADEALGMARSVDVVKLLEPWELDDDTLESDDTLIWVDDSAKVVAVAVSRVSKDRLELLKAVLVVWTLDCDASGVKLKELESVPVVILPRAVEPGSLLDDAAADPVGNVT